jgi:hypothetical protein
MAAEVQNGNGGNRVTLSLRSLINSHLSKPQLAFVGKKIKHGMIELELTNKAIAQALGVSVAYLNAAEQCDEIDEHEVKEGLRPLIWPKDGKAANGESEPASGSLDLAPGTIISDVQLDDIARCVGPERMWDALNRALAT